MAKGKITPFLTTAFYARLLARLGRWLFETNDYFRMRKQQLDEFSVSVETDIPYIEDGTQEHLLDIYRPNITKKETEKGKEAKRDGEIENTKETERDGEVENTKEAKRDGEELPVIVNIHGGGLFASYKNVNKYFNYEWTRKGYTVVSISYRRIPETTTIHQIEDVMAALRFIQENREKYHLNLDRCFLTGDSAGALLSFFALSIENSASLQQAFGVQPSGIRFRAASFISIMFDTYRGGLLRFMKHVVVKSDEIWESYYPYILHPDSMLEQTVLPPIYLVTSAQDIIQEDSLKLDRLLSKKGVEHQLLNFPKRRGRNLVHVFSVQFPNWPESKKVYNEIDTFFKQQSYE